MVETSERIEIAERWWSCGQIGDALGLSEQCVSRWCRDGLLQAYRFGGRWRIADSDLQRFLAKVRHAAGGVRQGGEPGEFAEKLRQGAEANVAEGVQP